MDLNTFHQTVKEFQEISVELEKLSRTKKLRRVLRLILIGFFMGKDVERRISEFTKKRNLILESVNESCTQSLEIAKKRIKEIEDSGTYLIYVDKEQFLAALESLETDLAYLNENEVLDREFFRATMEEIEKSRQSVLEYNQKFIEQRKRDYSHLWQKRLLSLDEEQQEAIVTDDKHNLVVAAAGSGKTEVLITRIAYLIARKPDGVRTNRILAIAYQKKRRERDPTTPARPLLYRGCHREDFPQARTGHSRKSWQNERH